MEGACTSELSNPPKPKRIRTDAGRKTKRSELSSPPELKQIKKMIPVAGRERQHHKLVINSYQQKNPAVLVTRHVIQK